MITLWENSWKIVTSAYLPVPLAYSAALTINNQVYLFGNFYNRLFTCMEAIPYAIKNQRKAKNAPSFGCLELCLYGKKELASWMSNEGARPMPMDISLHSDIRRRVRLRSSNPDPGVQQCTVNLAGRRSANEIPKIWPCRGTAAWCQQVLSLKIYKWGWTSIYTVPKRSRNNWGAPLTLWYKI